MRKIFLFLILATAGIAAGAQVPIYYFAPGYSIRLNHDLFVPNMSGTGTVIGYDVDSGRLYRTTVSATTPGGNAQDIQFKRNSAFSGTDSLKWDGTKQVIKGNLQFTATPTNSVDFGILNDATTKSIVVTSGTSVAVDCNAGATIGLRGNTYTALAQKGAVFIMAGNVASPSGDLMGSINFYTGSNVNAMRIGYDQTIRFPVLAGTGSRVVTTDASGNLSPVARPSRPYLVFTGDGSSDPSWRDPLISPWAQVTLHGGSTITGCRIDSGANVELGGSAICTITGGWIGSGANVVLDSRSDWTDCSIGAGKTVACYIDDYDATQKEYTGDHSTFIITGAQVAAINTAANIVDFTNIAWGGIFEFTASASSLTTFTNYPTDHPWIYRPASDGSAGQDCVVTQAGNIYLEVAGASITLSRNALPGDYLEFQTSPMNAAKVMKIGGFIRQ